MSKDKKLKSSSSSLSSSELDNVSGGKVIEKGYGFGKFKITTGGYDITDDKSGNVLASADDKKVAKKIDGLLNPRK